MALGPSLEGVVIETERLRLLPVSEEHADDVFANFTPDVTTYMFPAPATDIEETLAYLRSARAAIAAGGELHVVIQLKQTGEFLGISGLHHLDTSTPELGIWIKQAAHGHRYGREAIRALCDWALERLDFQYLKYPVDRRNTASRRIPESLGGRVEAEYEETSADGQPLDLLEFRLYRTDLEAPREEPRP